MSPICTQRPSIGAHTPAPARPPPRGRGGPQLRAVGGRAPIYLCETSGPRGAHATPRHHVRTRHRRLHITLGYCMGQRPSRESFESTSGLTRLSCEFGASDAATGDAPPRPALGSRWGPHRRADPNAVLARRGLVHIRRVKKSTEGRRRRTWPAGKRLAAS